MACDLLRGWQAPTCERACPVAARISPRLPLSPCSVPVFLALLLPIRSEHVPGAQFCDTRLTRHMDIARLLYGRPVRSLAAGAGRSGGPSRAARIPAEGRRTDKSGWSDSDDSKRVGSDSFPAAMHCAPCTLTSDSASTRFELLRLRILR